MQRFKRTALRALSFVLIGLMLLTPALAAPTPPPLDAPAYDEAHPEALSAEQLYARSAILIDQDTGQVLFEKEADRRMYPASTTKIMTLMLALEYGPLGEMVTVPQSAAQVPADSSTVPIKPGERMLFDDLLYGLMIRSGNDAANAIATIVSGSVENFVELMNQRAEELGLSNTHFTSAHGYHDEEHYTTARDLARLAQAAMREARVSEIASAVSHELPANNLRKKARVLRSETEFLAGMDSAYSYPYATGLKTGTTQKAGKCFVGTAEKEGIRLISVVLFSTRKYEQPRWIDTIRLMDYGFSQYGQFSFSELYGLAPLSMKVDNADPHDPYGGVLELRALPEAGDAPVLTGLKRDADQLARSFVSGLSVTYLKETAPIGAGEEVGYAQYAPQSGAPPVRVALVASRALAAAPAPAQPLIWLAVLSALLMGLAVLARARAVARRRARSARRRGPRR